MRESRIFVYEYVTVFFKSVLKNKRIELGVNSLPVYREITICLAKMYYETTNENFKSNTFEVLQYINSSEKFARLLDNVQHPANQNIYIESNRMKAMKMTVEDSS